MPLMMRVLIALSTSGALLSVAVPDASACSEIADSVLSVFPEEGARVGPNVQPWVIAGGIASNLTLSLTGPEDQVVELSKATQTQTRSSAQVHALSPAAPLSPGTYTLTMDFAEDSPGQDAQRTFIVAEDTPEDAHGEVDFSWRRESFAQDVTDGCTEADEYHEIALQPLASSPAAYQVTFVREGSQAQEIYPVDEVDGSWDAFFLDDVRCVQVAALNAAGKPGERVEKCVPDLCNDLGDTQRNLGTTNWESVEGCADGDGPETNEQAQGVEKASGERAPDEVRDEAKKGGEEPAGRGCQSATPPPAAPPLTLVLLVGATILVRRVTHVGASH